MDEGSSSDRSRAGQLLDPPNRGYGTGRCGATLAGLVYLAAWIVGLAIWPTNVEITDSSREAVNVYGFTAANGETVVRLDAAVELEAPRA